ncbi:hypothetical protein BH24ACT5_BH24ACT5_12580 [soil metagenome]
MTGERGAECCVAADLAARTEAVRLIVQLQVGADNPATLAEEIAVLDNLSNGRVVVIADVSGLTSGDAPEDVELLRHALSGRPIQHRGGRWSVPAGLAEHVAPAAVMLAPPPAQIEVPFWLVGIAPADVWDRGPVCVVTSTSDVAAGSLVQPARDRLSGDLDTDRTLVAAWAAAGATHLLLEPPAGWQPDDLATVSRHLAPEVAMVDFPKVIVSAPAPQPWPHDLT